MLKVIELFAGIGAQRQALKKAGIDHEVVAISEIDKYALKVYEKLHGATCNLGDITKIEKLPKADLWTYSFPCTDISISGRLGGLDKESGTHSSLLWEVERLIKLANQSSELPKYLLMENVKNLLSKRFKLYFDIWCEFLSSLGYKNYYKVLNAKEYGIPQNRERVFMLSILNDDKGYTFPKGQELKSKLADYLENDVDEKYYLSDKMINYLTDMKDRNGLIRGLQFTPKDINKDTLARTITTKSGTRPCDNFIIKPIVGAIRGRVEDDNKYHQHLEINASGNFNTITTVPKDNIVIVPQATKDGYAIANIGDGIYTNRCKAKRGVVQKSAIPTLKTSCSDVGVVVSNNDLISIRRLTPRESFRLMGWLDNEIDIAFQAEVSETQLYKMAGNSIVVNCLTEIFKNLKER